MLKGCTDRYDKIAVNHTTNLLRSVFLAYRLNDRLPTYAWPGMTYKVK